MEETGKLTQNAAAAEAILFAMGDSVKLSVLAHALECSQAEAEEAVQELADHYERTGSALQINRYEDAVQISTRGDYFTQLVRVAAAPRKMSLTGTLLETLSIVAYKQPVTRQEVESIRGVNSDFAINRLVSYDLVREVGRKEAPGRPLLFGTTEQFLRSFGIASLEELPSPDAQAVEEMREEAEAEVDTRLGELPV